MTACPPIRFGLCLCTKGFSDSFDFATFFVMSMVSEAHFGTRLYMMLGYSGLQSCTYSRSSSSESLGPVSTTASFFVFMNSLFLVGLVLLVSSASSVRRYVATIHLTKPEVVSLCDREKSPAVATATVKA
eukprot:16996_2